MVHEIARWLTFNTLFWGWGHDASFWHMSLTHLVMQPQEITEPSANTCFWTFEGWYRCLRDNCIRHIGTHPFPYLLWIGDSDFQLVLVTLRLTVFLQTKKRICKRRKNF